jgi:hypothetical protein
MKFTVQEAENLICPFMEQRIPLVEGGYCPEPKNCNCQINNCMAWRWDSDMDDPQWCTINKKNWERKLAVGYCCRLEH